MRRRQGDKERDKMNGEKRRSIRKEREGIRQRGKKGETKNERKG